MTLHWQVAKLQYVLTIKEIPTIEGRNAELALWRRRPEEAEAILIQAGLIYRCIDMHIRCVSHLVALHAFVRVCVRAFVRAVSYFLCILIMVYIFVYVPDLVLL